MGECFKTKFPTGYIFRNVLSTITSKNSYYAYERKIMSSSLDNLEQGKDKKEKTKP